MPQQPSPTILLLKTKSSPEDKYDTLFRSKSFIPEFIPVLTHHFHQRALDSVHHLFTSGGLLPGPNRQYGGLIFTSQRAVEGFASVLDRVDPSLLTQSSHSLPIYTVGPATSSSLSFLSSRALRHSEIVGGECGNGDCLAKVILSHYNALHQHLGGDENEHGKTKPPLLFLTGEQHRDVIPKTLTSASLPGSQRINLEERIVYGTGIREGFGPVFWESLVRLSPGSEGAGVMWVVVFSPSGCESMISVLEGLGLRDGVAGEKKVFVATIGSTTRDCLRGLGLEADVCAERPSPEGLWDGISRFMDGLGGS